MTTADLINMGNLLNTLTRAVSYTFRKDGTCPGVLFSYLRDGSVYASIVRYGSGDEFKNGKKVVCKCTASDTQTAVKFLADEFLKISKVEPNPVDQLRELVEK